VFQVDPGLTVPPYEQLRAQVIDQIASGELEPGVQLPTVRKLASDLGLAANTVARAYRELEAEGFVRTQGRRGTVVAGERRFGPDAERAAETFSARMRELGVPSADALRLVRTVLEAQA
jgi:GntR family transcriptional regulator